MKNKASKSVICGLAVVLISFSLSSFRLVDHSQVVTKADTVAANGYKIRTIIVDPGHGGTPTGTGHFSHGADGSYSHERIVTLAIAQKLQAAIEKEMPGVKSVLTRKDENDVSFEHRAQIANDNKGDVFVSIHCNSLPEKTIISHGRRIHVADRSGKGVLMLVYGLHRTREEERAIEKNQVSGEDSGLDAGLDPDDPTTIILTNEYKRKFRLHSIKLATLINDEITQGDGRPSDGIREQGIYVLCNVAMPSVLVETGYINNPDDEAYLNSETGQNEIVASIVRALQTYKDEVEGTVPPAATQTPSQ